ncbi:hypothetical protein MML48_2g00012656 [Holotrichia oblita]|uniref:Uncharacterized protein n=1 Tax=Holotrichia oblita TaxID=644536 RepID=A0ACB9TMV3_HOLOL|nr:hypothetical protein MML48_2g00012656 [Holotrichia oblita]
MENVEEFFDDGELVLNPYPIGLLLEGPQEAEANAPEDNVGGMLVKQESFVACSDRFGISTGTGHLIFHSICSILCDMRETEINWPVPDEARATATYFLEKSRFPRIIDAIDGCHIPIKAPNICVGMPGKCHDARVFRNSPLFHKMSEKDLIPHDFHLLGDSAYPLLPNLMVPFRDNGQLNDQERNFNYKLNSCRSKIEQAFGRLKGKWRKLKYVDISIESVATVITAACVLHNYTLHRDANIDEFPDVVEEDVLINDEGQQNIQNTAALKR